MQMTPKGSGALAPVTARPALAPIAAGPAAVPTQLVPIAAARPVVQTQPPGATPTSGNPDDEEMSDFEEDQEDSEEMSDFEEDKDGESGRWSLESSTSTGPLMTAPAPAPAPAPTPAPTPTPAPAPAAPAAKPARPDAEEVASFSWGGVQARPRKGQLRVARKGETYLKPPGSCGSKWGKELGVSICISACEGCSIYILDVCAQARRYRGTNCE